jgi:DNA polymerase
MQASSLPELEALHEEIRTHGGCGFEVCESATNMVPGEGDPDAQVMIVGEAPGASEDKQGRPFVGRAGKLLDQLLAEASLDRGAVYITNVLKARPPENRDPRADEVAHSMPWLDRQLELIEPKLVVTLGRHALVHFVPGGKITQLHGQVVEAGERRLFPMYHPAAALRNPKLRETLHADARALREAL